MRSRKIVETVVTPESPLNPQQALPGNHSEVLRARGAEDAKIQDLTPVSGKELPEPQELAADAIAELEAAVEELNSIISVLQEENNGGLLQVNEAER